MGILLVIRVGKIHSYINIDNNNNNDNDNNNNNNNSNNNNRIYRKPVLKNIFVVIIII